MIENPEDRGEIRTVRFQPRNVWQVGFVVIALVAVALLLRFVIDDAGSVLFTILMAWFASIAMEPAVGRLARHMRRGAATGLVMLSVAVFLALFGLAFGQLFVDQIAELLDGIPSVIDSAVAIINERLGTAYTLNDILTQINLTPQQVAAYGAQLVGGIFGLVTGVLGGFFSVFTFLLFAFYLSADGPRFRRYIASLFPPRLQPRAVQVWDVTQQKVGGYVAARIILATVNASTTAVVFVIIGMPSWLALSLWTGIVAQFVPTIGTYIAIALPVLVGLLSDNPWVGVAALAWGLIYQQVENLTIEPKISARAVDVHPAVAFASVMVGAALFGVAGALLAVPVSAMLITLVNLNRMRFSVRADLAPPGTVPDANDRSTDSGNRATPDSPG